MTAPAAGYDATFGNLLSSDTVGAANVMFNQHRQQDITPSSARRSDGDARYQLIPSESFWSQSDFSGGYGRTTPADPTIYYYGPADTLEGRCIRAALAWTPNWNGLTAAAQPECICAHNNDAVYVAVNDAGTGKLYSLIPSTATWASLGNLPTTGASSMVSFRGAIWIAYGSSGNAVQKYDVATATLSTPAPNFYAEVLCPYSSMLFYARYDSTTQTWRLNRYDPENTGAVADLAIVPYSNSVTNWVRSLVALGPDLFVVTRESLWKFTSANGNAGTLIGPVDTWVPAGSGARTTAGYGAVAFQNALVYPVGSALRRHQPGGGAKQIWPVPPSINHPQSTFDATGGGRQITQLLVAEDRLYAVSSQANTEIQGQNAHEIALFCWTGLGMHWLSTEAITYTGTPTLARSIAALDGRGYLVAATRATGAPTVSKQLGYWGIGAGATKYRAATTIVRTSILDFGMADIEKIVSQVRLRCYLPNTSNYDITGSLGWLDESVNPPAWTAVPLTRSGNFSTTADAATFVNYTASQPKVAKRFMFTFTITCPTSTVGSPEIEAITCIPNPMYPLRYGFRLDIPIGTHVKNHAGALVYADQTAVDAAVAYWRSRRSSGLPFTMDFLDGVSYNVRLNTIAIARNLRRPDESAWTVTLDLQQLTG